MFVATLCYVGGIVSGSQQTSALCNWSADHLTFRQISCALIFDAGDLVTQFDFSA